MRLHPVLRLWFPRAMRRSLATFARTPDSGRFSGRAGGCAGPCASRARWRAGIRAGASLGRCGRCVGLLRSSVYAPHHRQREESRDDYRGRDDPIKPVNLRGGDVFHSPASARAARCSARAAKTASLRDTANQSDIRRSLFFCAALISSRDISLIGFVFVFIASLHFRFVLGPIPSEQFDHRTMPTCSQELSSTFFRYLFRLQRLRPVHRCVPGFVLGALLRAGALSQRANRVVPLMKLRHVQSARDAMNAFPPHHLHRWPHATVKLRQPEQECVSLGRRAKTLTGTMPPRQHEVMRRHA